MLKDCWKWLGAGMALAVMGMLGGCGSGLVQTVEAATTMTVNAQLAQASAAVQTAPNVFHAVAGSSIQMQLSADGGVAPYQWSVAPGTLPKGLQLASDGTLSGTFNAPGAWSPTIIVSDASNPSIAKQQTITMDVASPLAVSTTALSGKIGTEYSSTLQATGGTPGYVWLLRSGSLPAGLRLNKQGKLSGIPAGTGTSHFAVAVFDMGSPTQEAIQTISMTIALPLNIASNALSVPTVGKAYSQVLSATGGTGSYTWTVQSGSLPAGLTLNADGTLTGTPTAAGSSAFTLAVADSSSPAQTASKDFAVETNSSPLSISTSGLSGGLMDTKYTAELSATGGSPAYTWTVASGALPAGLSLSSSGTISGTPKATGTSTFTVQATDSGELSQKKTAIKVLSMVVVATPLTITGTLPVAESTAAYTGQLSVSGGSPAYTWSVISGSMPTGLTLGAATGTISGTPTSTGNATFTIQVSDSSAPTTKTAAKTFSLNVVAVPLTITSGPTASAQAGTAYATQLSASGGTPADTWSIVSGSLPSGLTLGAATGIIQGTPTASGAFTFSYKVTDNSSPQQTATASATITVAAAVEPASSGTTWFIRPDGSTRYDAAHNPGGNCDGKADAPYPGVGINQHCAFNDVRWMWFNNSYGNYGWVMQGGDTLVIRGCSANGIQQNPDNPHCRVGGDKATGSDAQDVWCIGAAPCVMPPPPSGTAEQHTRILGGCAYDGNCTPVKAYPYTNNNLAQLYGGFNVATVINMQGSKYVDMEGLELTTHNGQCARFGITNALPRCNRIGTYPMSDQADQGIATDNTTSNVLLRDIYIHGFSSSGITGPIGGALTLTRVIIGFNTFAGWNFDEKDSNGVSIPNAPGSSITQSYVTMIGNGCQEEYPITHTQFPARGCWDTQSGGFGDAWSAQTSIPMDSFTCDHCLVKYNTKDGAMGPHTLIKNLVLTNSKWEGNMGSAHKWGIPAGGTMTVQNTINLGNCTRMSDILPGAAQNFDSGTNLVGSGLSNYCRAGGAVFAVSADAGTINFSNNTVVTYQPTIWQLSCVNAGCGTTFHFTDNLVLGYTSSRVGFQQVPAVYWQGDPSIKALGSHNLEYGIRNGDGCGQNGNLCSDPLLVNEPAQGSVPPESVLDNFNFHPSFGSPAVSYGIVYTGAPASDYYDQAQTAPLLTLGAVTP